MTPNSAAEKGVPPPPDLPARRRAEPVPAGDSYFEQLAAALPSEIVIKEIVPEGSERRGETVAEREARRLAARLPEGYTPESGADMSFDPRIAYELALGLSAPSEVFTKYGVGREQALALARNDAFRLTLRKYKDEVGSSGVSFRLKAKIQAEDLLTHSYILATDPEVPAAVRADLIKWTAKVAGLEPSDKSKGEGAGGAGFTLNITFSGDQARPGGRIITGEVTDATVIEHKGAT